MKRVLCLLLTALMLFSALSLSLSAAEALDGQTAAENLHALGLLAGVGKNADGSVNFDVNGNLTRAQAITQIVRFLGAEKRIRTSGTFQAHTRFPKAKFSLICAKNEYLLKKRAWQSPFFA